MEENVKRLELLLDGRTLSMAIEGRFTNLRVWTHKEKDKAYHVYMRLDNFNNYSAPLDEENILYLEKENKAVRELLNNYKFAQPITLADINNIIRITLKLKQRECKLW